MIARRLFAAALACLSSAALGGAPDPSSRLRALFDAPPAEARPMVRWWWFGPAVTDAEIDRELLAMKAGGFGGVEVQPTYPLAPDGAMPGLVNLPYLSPAFLARLAHASDTARREGLRFDLTLGSGWPFGGAHIGVDHAAAELRRTELPLADGASIVPLPPLGPGEHWLAAFIDGRRVAIAGDRLTLPTNHGPRAQLFAAGRTGQQVKRPAVGAEGFVLDHIDAGAVQAHLYAVGDRLMTAFAGRRSPDAIFSDSLEAYGSSWTGDLPAEFRRRRGYDLLEHLPALFADGEEGDAIRYDWARTLSELVDERYLAPIDAWARAHDTRFRAQVYGFPAPTMSSNRLVALPEGEGADWRHFTSTRWATSAARLYGRPVVSSETWTWLHSPAWAATPLDLKVEADRHFLQGVTQLVGHGWPYSPPGAPEPGWAFYAAAALNDHNPWYPAMPAVTGYLQRVSALLRAGLPDTDVGIYLPTEDAFAAMRPAHTSVNEQMRERLGDLIGQVIDAGHEPMLVDAEAVRTGHFPARALLLPRLTRIDPDAWRAIAAWVAHGGRVIAAGAPERGGGWRDGAEATRAVRAISARLFARADGQVSIVPEPMLGARLAGVLPAAVALAQADPAIGFVHRRLDGADLYFVANTGPTTIDTRARFAGDNGRGQWWDPVSGARTATGSGDIALRLAPYQSLFLVFADEPSAPPVAHAAGAIALAGDWEVSVAGVVPGRSWTETSALTHFSGTVSYARTVTLPPGAFASGAHWVLDLGTATPLPGPPSAADRPRAMLSAPVREAALVRVNGAAAGTIWAAPWQLDITRWLRPGANRIELSAMNTAVNALAGRPAIDRRLLTARYGERFKDQDVEQMAPAPSGLLGAISLRRMMP